ncbi:DUF302 domain-containing protein [Sulfurirhabdus autotrophica]|uniref:Uncharacterized protein (DUF302 family) n=1 Tax=Sulfurirhabdus autotrophica TaxID=1706046 RepID=A0A4R3YES3_9PROT|nr:DUF302 domain-containing protein [Sulfurirhabdus autotrophica]TCV90606.1 uncharacterized protein (DUF302 family) [Sulfurirhabdus autotrophica]
MKQVLITFVLLVFSLSAYAEDGMKDKASKFGFQETVTKLESVINEKGLTLFAKIDHAEGAKQAGLVMRPATVMIFGNPKGGTPFMVAEPKSAIDFPLKALVWENAEGKVFVSYTTVSEIVHRHKISGQEELTKKLDGLLAGIAKTATE